MKDIIDSFGKKAKNKIGDKEARMDFQSLINSVLLIIVGFLVWNVERKIQEDRVERKEAEKEQRNHNAAILKSTQAHSALLHPVARFSIKNGCNGNTQKALEDSEEACAELRDTINNRAAM